MVLASSSECTPVDLQGDGGASGTSASIANAAACPVSDEPFDEALVAAPARRSRRSSACRSFSTCASRSASAGAATSASSNGSSETGHAAAFAILAEVPLAPPSPWRSTGVHSEELAKTIDHTLLKADTTSPDVERLCREASKYHFAAVCVFPHYVPLADSMLRGADVKVCSVISFPFGAAQHAVGQRHVVGEHADRREVILARFAAVCVFPHYVPLADSMLRGADVKVCSVISFPFGADALRAKVVAAEEAVASGADEVDVVINLPAFLSGEFGHVRNELASVVRAVRMKAINTGRGQVVVKAIIETCYLTTKMKKLACKICEQAGVDFVKTSTGCGPKGATVEDVELLRDCLDVL